MNNPHFVFWWDSPCKGMIQVFKSFCTEIDPDSITVTGVTGKHREAMGWRKETELFPNHIIVEDDNWKEETTKIFLRYPDRIHVFGGITRPYFLHLSNLCIERSIPHIYMSEAYSNLYSGIKHVLKDLYIRFFLRYKVMPYAKNALGVLNLSGKRPQELHQFNRIGFKRGKILPFGYWTDVHPLDECVNSDGKIHMLCPGMIETYKGVDLLVKAMKRVIEHGCYNIVCHITGHGSEENKLKQYVEHNNLSSQIIFHGSLPENEYVKLLPKIDALIAPGRFEPWGIRVNEAIQRGQIVICSDGLGAAYLVEESKGGRVFKSKDITDLVRSLSWLSKLSREELNTLKRKNILYADKISSKAKAIDLYKLIMCLVGNNKE